MRRLVVVAVALVVLVGCAAQAAPVRTPAAVCAQMSATCYRLAVVAPVKRLETDYRLTKRATEICDANSKSPLCEQALYESKSLDVVVKLLGLQPEAEALNTCASVEPVCKAQVGQ